MKGEYDNLTPKETFQYWTVLISGVLFSVLMLAGICC